MTAASERAPAGVVGLLQVRLGPAASASWPRAEAGRIVPAAAAAVQQCSTRPEGSSAATPWYEAGRRRNSPDWMHDPNLQLSKTCGPDGNPRDCFTAVRQQKKSRRDRKPRKASAASAFSTYAPPGKPVARCRWSSDDSRGVQQHLAPGLYPCTSGNKAKSARFEEVLLLPRSIGPWAIRRRVGRCRPFRNRAKCEEPTMSADPRGIRAVCRISH